MILLTSHPILFHVGALAITAHGLFFALGAEFGYVALSSLARKHGLPVERLAEQVLLIFVAGLAAARIGYFLTYPSQFQSVLQVLSIWQGGLVSYFGIVGGLLAAAALFKEKRALWLQLVVVAALLAWGIGRLGNFWAGDSDGVVSAFWTATYGRVPIQLFESVLCFGLFAYWRHRPNVAGVLASYLLGRFFIDIWRDEGAWIGLHISQWVSLVLLIPLTIYLASRRVRR